MNDSTNIAYMGQCQMCRRCWPLELGDPIPEHGMPGPDGSESVVPCSGDEYTAAKHDVHANGECPLIWG